MTEVPATPPATLQRARAIAQRNGLRFVYTGNVHDLEGGSTCCSGCGEPVIVRDWHRILEYGLTDDGDCRRCGTPMPGRFGGTGRRPGPRRMPIRIAAA
jgi:pyruvate formate lyase activating enzyme